MAESTSNRFASELATANAVLADAVASVRSAASNVVAAIVDLEVEALRALERKTATLRQRLKAAADTWLNNGPLRLDAATADYLANWPGPPEELGDAIARIATGQARAAPFKRLFDRLVAGECDAEPEAGNA